MSYENKHQDWEQRVLEASASSQSAAQAAAILGVKYDTYKRYAVKYGCFVTNQPGKGFTKDCSKNAIPLEEILKGLHPQYLSNKLRIRLLKDGYFAHMCNSCGLEDWLGEKIPLELEHKDGTSTNHKLSNLELLCPNCHAQTSTYRGKNINR